MKSIILATSKQKAFQVLKFGMVGAICVVVDMFLFILLFEYLQVSYLIANFESTCLAILVNYYLSKRWVFKTGKHNAKIELVVFIGFSLAGLLINQCLIWVFVEKIVLDPKIGKLLAIVLVAIFNFITKKIFVFKG